MLRGLLLALLLALTCAPADAKGGGAGVVKTRAASAAYVATASDWDGTADSAVRGADLTGISDGKAGTFSGWVRIDGGDGSQLTVLHIGTTGGSLGWYIIRSSGNRFIMQGRNAAGATRLVRVTTPFYVAGATWYHILASWDLAGPTAHFYVNDAVPAFDTSTTTDDTLDYTRGNVGLSTNDTGSPANRFNGCLSEIFFHTTYIDLSVEANRRKFISATGKPVNLGATGSTPLGVQPLVYQKTGTQTNSGSGGNFTLTGALTACSSSPSD